MNHTDYLLEHPFQSLSLDDKIKIKELGPHQPFDFKLKIHCDKRNRSFNTEWFKRKPWLTISIKKESLFCFYCLLFGCDSVWTRAGYRDLKHLTDALKKHECSSQHLKSMLNYKTFNTVMSMSMSTINRHASIRQHNETVQKNRMVLSRIINILKFCGGHNFDLQHRDEKADSINSDIFLGLVSYTRQLDTAFNDCLRNSTILQNKTIQDELLDCINKVYLSLIEKEIKETSFVALQANETTDLSCKSQLFLILRYVKDTSVVERFLGFFEVDDLSGKGMANVLTNAIEIYNLKEKLIALTYDGAAIRCGNEDGVHTIINQEYPYAYFVHGHALMFFQILKNSCCLIKNVRIFFANLSGFSTFFSCFAWKNLLLEVCNRKGLPKTVETRLNFEFRIVEAVLESKYNIIETLELILVEHGDDITVREANELLTLLKDDEFNYFLNLFYKIFTEIDIFYDALQLGNCIGSNVQDKVDNLISSINSIRNNVDIVSTEQNDLNPAKRIRCLHQDLDILSIEICDIIINQIDIRFSNYDLITAFEIINPKKFHNCDQEIHLANLKILVKYYSFLNFELLRCELNIICNTKFFQKLNSVSELYNMITENNLEFSQTKKLAEIVLATPVTSIQSEKSFNTLKNIETYKSSLFGQKPLNSLAILSIEKALISKISNFNSLVINLFASQEHRKAEYLFK